MLVASSNFLSPTSNSKRSNLQLNVNCEPRRIFRRGFFIGLMSSGQHLLTECPQSLAGRRFNIIYKVLFPA